MSPDINIAPLPTAIINPAQVSPDQNRARELETRNVSAFYGSAKAVEGINLKFSPNVITALIGPSGCGKSTLLRCLNRMHEVIKGAYATGEVLLDGDNIYSPDADPVRIRRRTLGSEAVLVSGPET